EIGIASQSRPVPCTIRRPPARRVKLAQRRLVLVADAVLRERAREKRQRELRVPSRTGRASHIDELAYAHRAQISYELSQRPSRVPDRIHRGRRHRMARYRGSARGPFAIWSTP